MMFHQLPGHLAKAAWLLIIGILAFSLSLFVAKPLSFIFTLGLGALCAAAALLLFLAFFWREVKAPVDD